MRPIVLVAGLAAIGAAVAAFILLGPRTLSAVGHDDDDGHPHPAVTAFGESGDPRSKSREVQVAMREHTDGRMAFDPDVIEVRRGEQIRFVIRNEGAVSHEMIVATLNENLRHAEEMKRNPDMMHDDPNGTRLQAHANGQILWKFTKAGEFDFSCLIPGHRESGMHGRIVVK